MINKNEIYIRGGHFTKERENEIKDFYARMINKNYDPVQDEIEEMKRQLNELKENK